MATRLNPGLCQGRTGAGHRAAGVWRASSSVRAAGGVTCARMGFRQRQLLAAAGEGFPARCWSVPLRPALSRVRRAAPCPSCKRHRSRCGTTTSVRRALKTRELGGRLATRGHSAHESGPPGALLPQPVLTRSPPAQPAACTDGADRRPAATRRPHLSAGGQLDGDQRPAPPRPAARDQHPKPTVDIGPPWPFDGALEDSKLVAESEDLSGQLAPPLEEGERCLNQRADDVQHGLRRWLGSGQTQMISSPSEFSGGTATEPGPSGLSGP